MNAAENQSEFHRLGSVLLSPVDSAFTGQDKLMAEWKALNYTEAPDFRKAQAEYASFESLFRERGINCFHLPNSQNASLDAIYCRDAAVATNHGMILCSMGKSQRRTEPEIHKAFYKSAGIPILGQIKPPGTLEGGDIAWLDSHTLAVGHSYRTNEQGIRQLKTLLAPLQIEVIVAELPHYKGPEDVFHLMSVLSPIRQDLAVVYSPLLPIGFRKLLLRRGYDLVEVPEQEFDTLGCNVLALSPETCVLTAGNPIIAAKLKDRGLEVLEYQGSEISIKGGGGPTCLTRPLKRTL